MAENITPRFSELSRSYGTNWTRSNVGTLFDWINIAAFNIRCLELCIDRYRRVLRYQMILSMVLSTSSGTLSVSQFGFSGSQTVDFWIRIVFTIFSFMIALGSGALKVYQIQERLEAAIRLKNDWTVFSTNIASELQRPIELRHDALYTIDKYKNKYLDLLKTEMDVTDAIKKQVATELPLPAGMTADVLSLSRILMDICISEMNDFKSSNVRNRDRFSRTIGGRQRALPAPAPQLRLPASPMLPPQRTINEAVPESVTLDVAPPPPNPPPPSPQQLQLPA
jgi:hypothetical protein